jgi:hypothetical protein
VTRSTGRISGTGRPVSTCFVAAIAGVVAPAEAARGLSPTAIEAIATEEPSRIAPSMTGWRPASPPCSAFPCVDYSPRDAPTLSCVWQRLKLGMLAARNLPPIGRPSPDSLAHRQRPNALTSRARPSELPGQSRTPVDDPLSAPAGGCPSMTVLVVRRPLRALSAPCSKSNGGHRHREPWPGQPRRANAPGRAG